MYGSLPKPQEPLIEIFRLAPKETCRFLIRSKAVCSISTHWAAFTRLCAGDACQWCSGGFERNWRGYIAAKAPTGRTGLVEISSHSFDQWESAFQRGELTGKIVTVQRTSRFSGVCPILSSQSPGPESTIVDTDRVFDLLCRVLRLPRRAAYPTADTWLQSVQAYAASQGPSPAVKIHAG